VKPDLVTTLPDERLLRPRDLAPNPDVLPKPFGRYAKFLVRTGLIVNQRRGERWHALTPRSLYPLALWLSTKPPVSVMAMTDVNKRIVAVHRAAPGFSEPAGRAMVLSAITAASHAFLAESSTEDEPGDRVIDSLRDAEREIDCSPVTVIDSFAVGRKQYLSAVDNWSSHPLSRSISDEEESMLDRLENEFDAKCVLARSARWSGAAGPMFSERLLLEACQHMTFDDQESMVGLSFSEKGRLVAINEAARGAAEHVTIGPRDLVKIPLLTGASGLAVVHNHPSGVALASEEDVEMSKRLRTLASCVGVEFIGSYVVGRDTGLVKV